MQRLGQSGVQHNKHERFFFTPTLVQILLKNHKSHTFGSNNRVRNNFSLEN